MRVCRWAERAWDAPAIVARQLGVKRRRWDTVVVEVDPEALEARAVFGERALDSDCRHVVEHAPLEFAFYRDCLPHPGYPWRYVREAIHDADDRGLIETRRGKNGRIELRRKWRYPDWVSRLVAIENKPDLDASAARALAPQIERDVALGLADEVWVATRATGERVEPALLERLPVEAGILAVGGESVDIAWHATSLATEEPGTRILENPDPPSAARFEYVSPEWKAEKRQGIAERAYEKGWRSFVEHMRTDCRHFRIRDPDLPLPYCAAKGRHVTPRECASRCGELSPEPPAWRTRGWPIEGGPGKAVKRLLKRQRERYR
ncbi:DUF5787 family protein [Natronomonas sp. EA1]|uniref:DUF5787 family protein n=1 Tax=Natronomonas sp. EA1 TaxID=3421655 RepID=UPI003EBC7675